MNFKRYVMKTVNKYSCWMKRQRLSNIWKTIRICLIWDCSYSLRRGLRIGELTSLNKEDIHEKQIHISKTETIYQDKDGKTHYDVKPFPKTEAGIRDVIIPDNCVWILDKIRRLCPFGQYVFMQDGERIRSYVFRTRLYFMMEQMGHTDISCLKKHYYYNRMNDEEKRQILNQVKAL